MEKDDRATHCVLTIFPAHMVERLRQHLVSLPVAIPNTNGADEWLRPGKRSRLLYFRFWPDRCPSDSVANTRPHRMAQREWLLSKTPSRVGVPPSSCSKLRPDRMPCRTAERQPFDSKLLLISRGQSRAVRRYDFPSMLAVKPMPRRLGAGGFISSRIAESMAAMASSCVASFFSIRASS